MNFLTFDRADKFLLCCSSTATIHVFTMNQTQSSYLGWAISYAKKDADAEYSFAQFRLAQATDSKAIIHDNQLYILTKDCKFFQCAIPAQGGNIDKA
jgi:hypothetical protein